ncbi:aconitate hydratase AcnA [Adlercreutzia sp. ZJ154]|uniref:aconitate hydratase AcnA n=1 Tax=Adlercreutzia sp. ZJ154 TaxID=2709790 RepID=UPI0013EAFA3A|nr:aconitate hydratase AcnA [Adlercreutzia sp. ZJ154]
MIDGLEAELEVNGKIYNYYPVGQIEGADKLPFSLRVLLENVLRCASNEEDAHRMARYIVDAANAGSVGEEVEFSPAHVLFQDFTGVPVFVDFAVMREACAALGGNSEKINPQVPCDLVIDHSVIADVAGRAGCMDENMQLEFNRNKERYEFLKWAQESFSNVRIVPFGQGICHQLNIEQFASVVMTRSMPEKELAYFDTLVGTDSHTPTANGIGVLGWGVGGIEAEAAALGQPITTLVPRVIGIHLSGKLASGVTAMDAALTFAEKLRKKGVVGCFVECFGPGVSELTATQRACISNMTPEYGCTCTLFPIDDRTLDFLQTTGRDENEIALVEAYSKEQGFWNDYDGENRIYSDIVHIDLGEIKPSVSGPSRPHSRFDLKDAKNRFSGICADRKLDISKKVVVQIDGQSHELTHGAIAIAAVTSCTTATDAEMMLAAGILARNAANRGLVPAPWVKTILAPGSHATKLLLDRAGLSAGLEKLGFYTCGFGCMSCIGNSGPLSESMHAIADKIELASVLSGNRNFEGRISPDVSQNYLMAPANVIAHAIAGTVDFDMDRQPLGVDADGNEVYLHDILPDPDELAEFVERYVTPDLYAQGSRGLYDGDMRWKQIEAEPSSSFNWDAKSTYVRRPEFFDGMPMVVKNVAPIKDARILALLGDFITTDHISPAGAIPINSPAAKYLQSYGIASQDFNTYGSRRGNHEVMMRGTFGNVKLQNMLADGRRGGWSRDMLTGEIMPIFDVAQHYMTEHIPSVVIAGKMYGSGSSRDWAAKGPMLIGVRAVIAESFERIHRSNLIGMGVLPLQFLDGENAECLGIRGDEVISIDSVDFSAGLPHPAIVHVIAKRSDGDSIEFDVTVRIDTPTEGDYYQNGGILQYVLRNLAHEQRS